ncbi:hypothetical protein ACWCPI_24505 [Streptomyces sp. NPDC001920]
MRLVTDSAGFRRILRAVGLAGVCELHSSLNDALAGTSAVVATG